MKQKFIRLSVTNDDALLYDKEPATPEQIMSALALFQDTGTVIQVEVCEKEIEIPNN